MAVLLVLSCLLSLMGPIRQADAATLSAPKNLRVLARTTTSITLTWDAVSRATRYQVEFNGKRTAKYEKREYTHKNLVPGSSHGYRVRAFKGTSAGAWSAKLTARTLSTEDAQAPAPAPEPQPEPTQEQPSPEPTATPSPDPTAPPASQPAEEPTAAPGDSGIGVAAQPADSLVDAMGVNVHLGYSSYSEFDGLIRPALWDLGVRHVRDQLRSGSDATYWKRHAALTADGIKRNFSVIKSADPKKDVQDGRVDAAVKAVTLDGIASFEGVNEPGGSAPTTADVTMAHETQMALWNTVRKNSTYKGILVVGPSFIHNATAPVSAYDDWTTYMDRGAQHLYPDGGLPLNTADRKESVRHRYVEGKNWFVTETGYHNYTAITGGVPESVQATYLPRLFLDFHGHSWGADVAQRAFAYELKNNKSEVSEPARGSNWGLMRYDGTRKPAFHAMKNLITLFRDPVIMSPGKLDYAISGADSTLRHRLYQKSDGSFLLAVWRDVSVWDKPDRKPITVTAQTIKVTLNGLTRASEEYVPRAGATAIRATSASKTHSLEVAGDLHVLRILQP